MVFLSSLPSSPALRGTGSCAPHVKLPLLGDLGDLGRRGMENPENSKRPCKARLYQRAWFHLSHISLLQVGEAT